MSEYYKDMLPMEAYYTVLNVLLENNLTEITDISRAMRTVKSLAEFATPMRPNIFEGESPRYGFYYCPICGEPIRLDDYVCPSCGQAIEW